MSSQFKMKGSVTRSSSRIREKGASKREPPARRTRRSAGAKRTPNVRAAQPSIRTAAEGKSKMAVPRGSTRDIKRVHCWRASGPPYRSSFLAKSSAPTAAAKLPSGRYVPHRSYVIHSGSSPMMWKTCASGLGVLRGDSPA
eukprot:scaffold111108_cov32-Tisochrysis_lutea.AAC.1